MIEKRKHRRDDLWEIVRYASSPNTFLRGILKDWSPSGICLIIPQLLEDGQEITVNHIVMPSSKKATVKWQQDIGKAVYKVGLEIKR